MLGVGRFALWMIWHSPGESNSARKGLEPSPPALEHWAAWRSRRDSNPCHESESLIAFAFLAYGNVKTTWCAITLKSHRPFGRRGFITDTMPPMDRAVHRQIKSCPRIFKFCSFIKRWLLLSPLAKQRWVSIKLFGFL